jgi:hypothetical protein
MPTTESDPLTPVPDHPAFRVALFVLGAVALVQVGAITWAIASRLELAPRTALAIPGAGEADPAQPATPAAAEETRPPAPSIPPAETGQDLAPSPGPAGAATIPASPALSPAAPAPVSPPVGTVAAYDPTAILDTSAAEQVREGNLLRESGDTQAALVRYSRALEILPGHPRVYYEIAKTYEAMGQSERATSTWEKIYRLGESAGDLFFIADAKLQVPGSESDRPFTIRSVETRPDPTAAGGQRVTLAVKVAARPGTAIDPSLFEAHVLFYDLVDGSRIDQTTADPPEHHWTSGPTIDWADTALGAPEETLEVTYFHPELTAEERARYGSREYYGYVIKLYYDGQLADRAAEPLTLLERLFEQPALEQPNHRLDGSLFPSR